VTAEKRGVLGSRSTIPFVLVIAAVILGGCSLFGRAGQGSGRNEASAAPSPSAATDSASPGVSMSIRTELIDDAASGFTLLLPPGWVPLRAGDEGWVTVYGKHDSPIEQQVADGTIQDYALPLPARADDAALNLAVYVRTAPPRITLAQHADTYRATLESAQSIRDIQRDELDVTAGHAVRLSGLRSDSAGQGLVIVRLTAYILLSGNRVYFLDFVSEESSSDRYGPVFLSVMESLRFR
jgi:hypothetical protein